MKTKLRVSKVLNIFMFTILSLMVFTFNFNKEINNTNNQ